MAQLVRIGHSPDADDAFMFYALTHGKVAIPGVRNATLSKASIMGGGAMVFPLNVRGKPVDITKALVVGPSFFTTMQIPILMGHDLEDRGRAAAVPAQHRRPGRPASPTRVSATRRSFRVDDRRAAPSPRRASGAARVSGPRPRPATVAVVRGDAASDRRVVGPAAHRGVSLGIGAGLSGARQ